MPMSLVSVSDFSAQPSILKRKGVFSLKRGKRLLSLEEFPIFLPLDYAEAVAFLPD
jgi:hypothetical protein